MENENQSQKLTVHQRMQVIQAMSALVARMGWAQRLGQQYDGKRDVFEVLGYPKTLTYDDYYAHYMRQDLAAAIINRPIEATWSGPVELNENDTEEETEFERTWAALMDNETLGLKDKLIRVDTLSGIGEYAVLLFGFDDVKTTEAFKTEVSKNAKLKYVKPFDQATCQIKQFDVDPSSERYGLPLLYDFTVVNVSTKAETNVVVHWTRVLHITDTRLESDVYGIPVLMNVFNRLIDIEKIVGGSGEMFWRNGRPGYQGVMDKDFAMGTQTKEDMETQLDEMEHDFRRFLTLQGMKVEALGTPSIADPNPSVDIQIQMISAAKGIPKRILTGSERGELASSQDADEWKAYITNRRTNKTEVNIIRPLVSYFQRTGVLPVPKTGKYDVKWSDLFALSEKERVEIGKGRATAIKEYVTAPLAEYVMPVEAFLEFCLGFTSEQIELIQSMTGDTVIEDIRQQQQAELQKQMAKNNPQGGNDPNSPNADPKSKDNGGTGKNTPPTKK